MSKTAELAKDLSYIDDWVEVAGQSALWEEAQHLTKQAVQQQGEQ